MRKPFIIFAIGIFIVVSLTRDTERAGLKYNKLSISTSDLDVDFNDLKENRYLVQALSESNTPFIEQKKPKP